MPAPKWIHDFLDLLGPEKARALIERMESEEGFVPYEELVKDLVARGAELARASGGERRGGGVKELEVLQRWWTALKENFPASGWGSEEEVRRVAQGDFTKQEADATMEAVDEMFSALTKRRTGEFFGHLNDIMLFLEAAKKVAPDVPE